MVDSIILDDVHEDSVRNIFFFVCLRSLHVFGQRLNLADVVVDTIDQMVVVEADCSHCPINTNCVSDALLQYRHGVLT